MISERIERLEKEVEKLEQDERPQSVRRVLGELVSIVREIASKQQERA